MRGKLSRAVVFVFGLICIAPPLQAQDGALTGTVTDLISGDPVGGANVRAVRGFSSVVSEAVAGADGAYRLELPAGTYVVVTSAFGYVTRRAEGVAVEAGSTMPLAIALEPHAFVLNPLVVSPSRTEQEALTVPAAVYTVRQGEVEERVAITPIDHIRELPGVDPAQSSIQQSYVVTRGFNNVYTGSLRVLTDGRYAQLPSVRLNADYMIPANDLDIESIELSLGPGAAVYGPDTANGVMQINTKSPIDHPGTSISVAGGERSIFHGMFRTAFASEKVGFKVSGEYFRGDDWESVDPVEEAAREADPDNPLLGARDFRAARWSTEARLDYRPDDRTDIELTGGHNFTDRQLELTGVGRGQQIDYKYSFLQGRLERDRFELNLFANFIDSGESRLLRTGQVAIDKSRLYAARLKHGSDIGSRQSFLYGVDLQRTDARTEGTINGRFEDDDTVDEIGAYLHSETSLSDQWDLLLAGRLDFHSELEDPVFSPRAALSFSPAPDHTIRASFNRGFITPTAINLFLDLQAAAIPIIPGFIEYDLRAVGVPETGFTFAECTGGFDNQCMRSPLMPGAGLVAADATLTWDVLIGALAPDLAPLLPNPGAQVGTLLRRLDLGAGPGENPFPVDELGAQDIARLVPTISNTFETGYKGLIGGRLLLSPSIYYTEFEDFIGPINPETPQVFFDPASTAAYVNQQLGPLVTAGVISQGDVDALVAGLAGIPVGTVGPEQWDSPDILLSSRNYGTFDMWGFDIGADFIASSQLTLRGSLSYMSEECLDFNENGSCFDGLDVALNAPKWKGSASARYLFDTSGFFTEARLRFIDGFPMNSGVYVGEVDAYAVVDLAAGAALPGVRGASIQLMASNIFDNRHQEFIGAPELGRLILLRLRYDF